VLHVPIQRRRHADEAHGLCGRGSIEHDYVIALFAAVLVHIHHGAQLFHAGQDGEFFGLNAADSVVRNTEVTYDEISCQ